MNCEKIDSALSAAINAHQALAPNNSSILVSVRTMTTLSDQQQKELKELGFTDIDNKNATFSALVTLDDLKKLSQKEYVKLVSLVRPEKPLPCLFNPPVALE